MSGINLWTRIKVWHQTGWQWKSAMAIDYECKNILNKSINFYMWSKRFLKLSPNKIVKILSRNKKGVKHNPVMFRTVWNKSATTSMIKTKCWVLYFYKWKWYIRHTFFSIVYNVVQFTWYAKRQNHNFYILHWHSVCKTMLLPRKS